jgi:sugar transferase (PEP-CTERM/EpsH1 system associated)
MPTELSLATVAQARDPRPLVVHVVYRFDTGGLENGVVNLIDQLPADAFRHAVVALTEVTDFRQRIRRSDVAFASLHKPPGQGLQVLPPLLRLLREWRPAIVHTRNLAALEMQLAAWLAGVPVRIHGEHGRDVDDLDGRSARHRWMRRLYRPFVQQHIALSRDLAEYLQGPVGVPAVRVRRICNGVDTTRFMPAVEAATAPGCPFDPRMHFIVGTVGRMQAVKHQTLLVRAFAAAVRQTPALRASLRLALVGDGPLRHECAALLADAGVSDLAWLPGERSDVPDVMRGLSAFVLPSLAEGISNTVLEAMASGLPVVATNVGGNADLVEQGRTGVIVPPDDVDAMARAIVDLAGNPAAARAMGAAGRIRAEAQFSLRAMVAAYQDVYETQLQRAGWRRPRA